MMPTPSLSISTNFPFSITTHIIASFSISMEETNLSSAKHEEAEWRKQCQELLQTLPKEKNWNGTFLFNYQGLWYPGIALKGLLFFQKHYKPLKSDIIIASSPKSGTTWLKALIFTIVNRSRYSLSDHPLLKTSTHRLVPFFEFGLCMKDQFPDLDLFPQPRVFATHTSYSSLPCSVKNSDNKIVYVCRNPLDLFISQWHFTDKYPGINKELVMPLEEAFEAFCGGINSFGPFWDHISGYFKASIERPDEVLFLKYEDMKENSALQVKKLASFLGFSFSEEEEKQGLAEEIAKFCSFESMKKFEVNKNGVDVGGVANSAFFRKGEVGDSLNYLSPNMVERLEKIAKEKLGDLGLIFKLPG